LYFQSYLYKKKKKEKRKESVRAMTFPFWHFAKLPICWMWVHDPKLSPRQFSHGTVGLTT
jgi:hypothetical protein